MNITETFKRMAVGGKIDTKYATRVAAELDNERAETISLLQNIIPHVGMFLGEQINEHLARMNGSTFNSREYNFEKMPDGQ